MMRKFMGVVFAVMAVLLVAGDALAQGGGRGRGGQRGGPGGGQVGKLALLSVDAVAKDLGLSEAQAEQIAALRDEMRGERPQRQNPRDMSDDERQALREQMQSQRAERQKLEDEKLATILDASQQERLDQIVLQAQGVRALMDPKVQSKLGLPTDTVAKLEETAKSVGDEVRSKMGELFRSGDRDSIREKMTQLRKESEEKILAVLSDAERKAFADMKGAEIDLGLNNLRGGRQRGGGGDGGGRPSRDARPELE